MTLKPRPSVVIFCGPNGFGKPIHADVIVATLGKKTLVNAGYIAQGLLGRHTDAVVALPLAQRRFSNR